LDNFGTVPNLDVKSIKNSIPGRRSSYLKFPIGTAGKIGSAIMPPLAQHFRVIAVDVRGMGSSSKP